MEITQRFWAEIERRAFQRNIPFLITSTEAWKIFLIQNRKCAITGIELNFTSCGYRGTASLDRIESCKPYDPLNIQWVLGDINIMKKDHNMKYFKQLCCLVANSNQSH